MKTTKLMEACMLYTKEYLYHAYNEAARQHRKPAIDQDAFDSISRELLAVLVTDMILLTDHTDNVIEFRVDPEGIFTIKI